MKLHPATVKRVCTLLTAMFMVVVTPALLSQTTPTTRTKRLKPAKPPASNAQTAPSASDQSDAGATARGVQRGHFTEKDKNAFEMETRTAILVAPSYRDSGLATLRYTFADAVELKAELERQGYSVRVIPSTEATADSIRQALTNQKILLDGTTQATVVFAFMGHGFQDNSGHNYLMTYGADLDNMDKEALSLDEVQKLLNETGARRKVVFIDACRNVPGSRDASAARTMSDFQAAEGMAMLLATKPGAYSYEDPELSHGVFTYFLLEALRGKAAGKDGYVTFHDVSQYVEHSVLSYSLKKDLAQKPLATLRDVGGDFLLATAAPPKPEDIKANIAASQITSDATLMRAVQDKRSFFVDLNETTLTLMDSTSGQPYAILNEHPDQLKDKTETAKRSLRWFSGTSPDNSAVNMVAEMKGDQLLQLWGRIGKPCPGDKPCSATPFPLLPGEAGDKAAVIDKTKKAAAGIITSIIPFGGLARKAVQATQSVSSGTAAAESAGFADSRAKYIWTKLDLTSTAKPPVQASIDTKQ